jgi:hypothetical protein
MALCKPLSLPATQMALAGDSCRDSTRVAGDTVPVFDGLTGQVRAAKICDACAGLRRLFQNPPLVRFPLPPPGDRFDNGRRRVRQRMGDKRAGGRLRRRPGFPRIAWVRADSFPTRAAFPNWPEGRHPHCHSRGLLGLYSRYGPPDRSAAQGDLCHEAPALPVARPSRSLASRSIDNFLGGFFLHKCFAPSGRTANKRHFRPLPKVRERGVTFNRELLSGTRRNPVS